MFEKMFQVFWREIIPHLGVIVSHHCVRFSTTRLPIGKNAHIVPIKSVFHHARTQIMEHAFLIREMRISLVMRPITEVKGEFLKPRTVSG